MTVLTDKEQTVLRAIVLAGVPTHRTHLTRVVSINLHGHGTGKRRFVGNDAL